MGTSGELSNGENLNFRWATLVYFLLYVCAEKDFLARSICHESWWCIMLCNILELCTEVSKELSRRDNGVEEKLLGSQVCSLGLFRHTHCFHMGNQHFVSAWCALLPAKNQDDTVRLCTKVRHVDLLEKDLLNHTFLSLSEARSGWNELQIVYIYLCCLLENKNKNLLEYWNVNCMM